MKTNIILTISFILFFYFFFNIYLVTGISMHLTLRNGDLVFCSKYSPINKNDIVAVKINRSVVIKRITYEVGDSLNSRDLLITNIPNKEAVVVPKCGTFIQKNNYFFHFYLQYLNRPIESNDSIQVNIHSIFIQGDNYYNSFDSRIYGPIDTDKVIGKVLFSIPLSIFKF